MIILIKPPRLNSLFNVKVFKLPLGAISCMDRSKRNLLEVKQRKFRHGA